jgi:hypothetical protein
MATTEGPAARRPKGDRAIGQKSETNASGEASSQLLFESTKEFEDDLKRLPPDVRAEVVETINERCQQLLSDRRLFDAHLSRPYLPRLEEGFDSTLYVMRMDAENNVVLTVDDDPLFSRMIITLWRLVANPDVDMAFGVVAAMIYQGM